MSQERENPNVVAVGHSCARRSPYGSSPFTAIPVRFPPAGRYSRKSRALAEKYDSMSPWKSRWSLAEVGEDPHVEPDPLDPSLRGAVGRHLHQQVGGPEGDGLGRHRLEFVGERRGQPLPEDRAGHPVIDRADHRGDAAGRRQDRLDQVRDRRLPVGPRDARHPQLRGGIAVERHGHPRQHRRRGGDAHDRQGGEGSSRSTRAAAAPPRAASARYAWPSARAPGTATNRSPGRTERESTLIPPIQISPTGPAGTGTIPARRSASFTAPPCRRRSSTAAPP